MAKSQSVWGIEIGQTALKALRCTLEDGEVVADAFDYIEYPKILSQPEADADEMVAEAIQQLLERNEAINEKVCISVPGQSGLAKFFKPPPVEVKKVVDIVRYEARQQIPFDLDDVVWDFQMMPGSMVEEGYALESEVGLFAMKREQAYRQLSPFDEANIEVDVVQLAPLALYNMLAYDRFSDLLQQDMYDADNPPPSSVLLSIGTDSSDLIVSNGFRIWQRSMPIGGNHFTRQLTKDLKLTFAKAEHLKRNAREAVDPKLVFQTMRPVFNDLVTEVQRSIGFFRSIDKKAEIKDLLITGNTVKMPGLAPYLGKNLGYDVHVIDKFDRLKGDDVLAIPTFKDNAPTFAVCYGLCLQGLGVAQVHASLVPREILTARMIRAKKPWTLAGLAALMIGMSAHYAFTENSWATTHDDLWAAPISKVKAMEDHRTLHKSQDDELVSKLTYLNVMGEKISGNAEGRVKWMEIIKTINAGIPRFDDPRFNGQFADDYVDRRIKTPKEGLPYEERKDFHVTQLDSKYYEDLSTWFSDEVSNRYREELRNWARLTDNEMPEDETGPTGPGWVFEMHCYHYYNSPKNKGLESSNHIRKYMTDHYRNGSIKLPIGKDAAGNDIFDTFTFKEMGLSYPLLLDDTDPQMTTVPNPDFDPAAITGAMATGMAGFGAAATTPDEGEDPAFEPPSLQVQKQDFTYQIVWQETLISGRLLARENPEPAEGEAAAAAEATTPAAE